MTKTKCHSKEYKSQKHFPGFPSSEDILIPTANNLSTFASVKPSLNFHKELMFTRKKKMKGGKNTFMLSLKALLI